MLVVESGTGPLNRDEVTGLATRTTDQAGQSRVLGSPSVLTSDDFVFTGLHSISRTTAP